MLSTQIDSCTTAGHLKVAHTKEHELPLHGVIIWSDHRSKTRATFKWSHHAFLNYMYSITADILCNSYFWMHKINFLLIYKPLFSYDKIHIIFYIMYIFLTL